MNMYLLIKVESRYPAYKIPGDWPRMTNTPEESPEKIQKVLDDNVEQISSVRSKTKM